MGFGKFQSLVSIIVLIIQVAVVGLVDGANGRAPFFVGPDDLLKWACGGDEVTTAAIATKRQHSSRSGLWGICNRIRGGRVSEQEVVIETPPGATATATVAKEESIVVSSSSEHIDYSSSPHSFPLFQKNDGSQDDPDRLPTRYLSMHHNDREKAKRSLHATLEWRNENDINTILARPHSKFDVCNAVFPHYFCGRDDTDHVVLLQRPGLINLHLAHANGLLGEDLLYHYIYEMEYLWQVLEADKPLATMTSIIDLTGLNLKALKPEFLHVLKLFCSTMDAHFPSRAHKTLLINAPRWFNTIFKMISPLLRESTKDKISIFSKGKQQEEALQTLLNHPGPLEEIPPSSMEEESREFVSSSTGGGVCNFLSCVWNLSFL